MTSRDMTDPVANGEDSQTEGKCDTYKPNAKVREGRGYDSTPATHQYKKKSTDKFC